MLSHGGVMDAAGKRRENRIRALKSATQGSAPAVKKTERKSPLAFLRPYRPVFIALAIFILGVVVVNRKSVSDNGYVLTEHLDECAVSITSPYGDEIKLTMADLSRYIMRIEREGDIHARAYDEADPTAYWKLRISTDKEAGYISNIAKKTLIEYAVRDAIYSLEAERAGFSLDEERLKEIHYDAEREYFKMSQQAKTASGLGIADIEENLKKETLVRDYMLYLNDVAGGNADVGSDHYEKLKAAYSITEHTEVTGQFRPGYVTIN